MWKALLFQLQWCPLWSILQFRHPIDSFINCCVALYACMHATANTHAQHSLSQEQGHSLVQLCTPPLLTSTTAKMNWPSSTNTGTVRPFPRPLNWICKCRWLALLPLAGKINLFSPHLSFLSGSCSASFSDHHIFTFYIKRQIKMKNICHFKNDKWGLKTCLGSWKCKVLLQRIQGAAYNFLPCQLQDIQLLLLASKGTNTHVQHSRVTKGNNNLLCVLK